MRKADARCDTVALVSMAAGDDDEGGRDHSVRGK